MGKYSHLTREELIERLEKAEQEESVRLNDRLDGERRLFQALVIMLKNYEGSYEKDIMRIVLERYQADRAFLFHFDWKENTTSNIFEVNSEGIGSEIQQLQHLSTTVLGSYLEQLRKGKPLVVEDVEEMPDQLEDERNELKDLFAKLQIRSVVLFPMQIFGELWGFVGMETVSRLRKWSVEDIEWLKAFTDVLSIGVGQRLVRKEAFSNEQRFTELFRHMPLGYIRHRMIFDKDGKPADYEILEVNPAFEKLTGLKKEYCVGKRGKQLGTDKSFLNIYADIASSGKQTQMDYYSPYLKKWYSSVVYSMQEGEFVSLFYDITEQCLANEQIRKNEQKLRSIFDNLPVGILSYDEEGRFVRANEEAVRIFGVRRKENFRKSLLLSPEIKEELQRQQQVSFDFIYDNLRREALTEEDDRPMEQIRYITAKIMLYAHERKTRPGYLLIVADNTKIHRINRELQLTERALKENLIRLSLILETGEIYPWYMDLETGKLDISEEFYKSFNQNKSDYEDYTIREFIKKIHPGDVPLFRQEFEKLEQGLSERVKMELRLNVFGKGYIWCELNAGVRARGINSNISKWLGFLTVIQKRKDNEKQLVEALKKAEESDKLKSAFLANVSHEIRTPLNAIVGFSELIAHTQEEEDKKYYLDIVKTNNTLLLNLINDILDLSKIESGRVDLKDSMVDVNELCRELCEVHQLRAEPGVKVIFENPGDALQMLTDRNRLIQLYSNLISNAVKNTREGSIRVGYRRKEDVVEFTVQDTGKGIPLEKQAVIFNRFEKLDANVQGFGLGLSICKSILEKMGGSIDFESEVGKGSRFRFILPYRQKLKSSAIVGVRKEKSEEILPEGKTLTILVAEDIDCNYELLKAILGKTYRLIRARTGIEAVTLFSEKKPDLILMDMKMPELDGIDATKIIRETSQEIPIVALTAFAYDSDRELALNAGCNDFITKPVDAMELKRLILKYGAVCSPS